MNLLAFVVIFFSSCNEATCSKIFEGYFANFHIKGQRWLIQPNDFFMQIDYFVSNRWYNWQVNGLNL